MNTTQKELLLAKMTRAGYRTFDALSKGIGMSPCSLSKRISGKIDWTDKEIKAIATALKLSPREIFDIFLA